MFFYPDSFETDKLLESQLYSSKSTFNPGFPNDGAAESHIRLQQSDRPKAARKSRFRSANVMLTVLAERQFPSTPARAGLPRPEQISMFIKNDREGCSHLQPWTPSMPNQSCAMSPIILQLRCLDRGFLSWFAGNGFLNFR
jgi:hypothetical protein